MSDRVETKARPLGINHVVLEVGDLDQALEFYGGLFEFKLRGKSDHNIFIDLGDQFIQLTLGRTQAPDTKRHFGLVVDDREAVRQAMERRGIKSINDRMNILDPWGNRIEIVPYDDCQFTKAPQVLKGMGASPHHQNRQRHRRAEKEGHGTGGIVRTSKEFFRASFKPIRCALRSAVLRCRLKFPQTISQSLLSVVIPLEE